MTEFVRPVELMTPDKIVLTGFMGTGKSTVGRLVAERLGYEFVDTDQMIEALHGPITDIFEQRGEATFRKIEQQVASELAKRSRLVVATGGRLMLDPLNVAALAPTSRIYCLSASPDAVAARVAADGSTRPLLSGTDYEARIAQLLTERGPHYRRFIQIETTGRSVEQVCQSIVELAAGPSADRLMIRPAGPADAEVIHQFIVGLAVYEREPDAVEATPASLRTQLESPRPPFECLIAEFGTEARSTPIGFALFYPSYSTWKGRPGIYLEDLFVLPEHRGTGAGKALLSALAEITVERDYGRLEWQVLDWNEPSIRFYEALGAEVMREWLPCRVSGGQLRSLAGYDEKI